MTESLLARIAEDEATIAWTPIEIWPSRRRVLAECEAKRRIVEEVAKYDGESYDGNSGALNSLDAILEVLAAIYADHPDYRAEWAL